MPLRLIHCARLVLCLILLLPLQPEAFAQHYRLWGTTYQGGAYGSGTLFRYTPQTDSLEVMSHFSPTTGPRHPYSGVIWDTATSKIYGTANDGGNAPGVSHGVIYSFRPSDSLFSTEYDCYAASGGRAPVAVPYQGGSHTLWGTDMSGGTNSYGTLYEFDTRSGVKTIRKNFSTSNSDGYDAYQGPVFAANGKLYGLTHGAAGLATGVLYCFDTTLKTYTVKHSFATGGGGTQPKGRLLACSNGRLYGTTTSDLFEYNPANDSFIIRQTFQQATTGSGSQGFLLEYAGGIWGLASGGGAYGKGTIFRYDTVTRLMTKKLDLMDSIGSSPLGGLCMAANGLMYAATNAGGTDNIGAIIAYDPIANTATNRRSFNYANGWNPLYTTLVAAWTNDCPRLSSLSLSDTLCAGTKDSVNLYATDGDGDTLQAELVISDTSKLLSSAFRLRYLGGAGYRLTYTADTSRRDTGLVIITGRLRDAYGGISRDSFVISLYLKDCTPPPNPAGILASSQGTGLTLSVRPNPAESVLWLAIPGNSAALRSCIITDVLGRQQTVMCHTDAGGQAFLSIGHLPPGIYHLYVNTADGNHYTASFVRQ